MACMCEAGPGATFDRRAHKESMEGFRGHDPNSAAFAYISESSACLPRKYTLDLPTNLPISPRCISAA
ncbi:hypothetical protein PENSUB_10675 [Penicillium subrubescens]|uniref:Uncharacterized protein n=1 Tax=Penicillium subrubescens TaxID=1316194 RepID=A0A1Q5T8H2_9EURO|nr:hypothetical protein PENSUB_10675 [Penicillium subrubescens]